MQKTIRDPALWNEWHPVALAEEIGTVPKGVCVLGEKIVLYRSSKGITAMRDLCIHRGVPLSLGRVQGDRIVCAYHGWEYDQSGACVCIPALPKHQAIPTKARTPTFACCESLGFVWVCLGEPSRPTPIYEDFVPSELIPLRMGPYPVQASGPRVVENFLDVSHLMFVHEGLLGDREFPEIDDYTMVEENGVFRSTEIAVYQPDPDGRGHGVTSRYTYEIFSPLGVRLTKTADGSDELFHLFLFVLPESETTCTAYMLQLRNYGQDIPDHVFVDFQNTLLAQDKLIVENQKPELLPLDLQAELHLKCDRVAIAYRRRLKELGVTFGTD
ncbi:aromatic ring-hydroxylating dioxygenase subunit alpha [Cohnella fermenti]|uniref:aromatic ring-hydroxylating dioxygenase subunit alpha n=1 Tax=Cohnella fermenti TaxID=2565925 RepID=UPI001B3B1C5E|nr:aromatic ring-hydroxylating dioxygenase subunit alpha [Cohnella fermenti]